jgi:hypothetical protein
MRKWIGGVAATVLAGVLVFWLTEGLLQKRDSDGSPAPAPTGSTPTLAPTLFDMRGVYTLIKIEPTTDPVMPSGLGISIEPRTATEGYARYRLPMEVEDPGDAVEGSGDIALIGSQLRIRLGENLSIWRDVNFSEPYLVLSWEGEGKKRSWTFQRSE